MLAIFKKRPHSYDQDWMGAFAAAGFELTDQPTKFHDLTVILQSVTAQWEGIPDWIRAEAKNFKGRLVFFPGNEYTLFGKKNNAATMMGATIATQLPIEVAKKIYTAPVMEVPHALNADYFTPEGSKKFDIGVRGNTYKPIVGDDERNRICTLWKGLKHDCQMGKEAFLDRSKWRAALRSWACMPSTEGGSVGSKCVTPRHFDAIGTHTCLVMYPGFFNGILKPEHYIRLERDHSNLADVKRQVQDRAHCLDIVRKAREYCLDGHTYAHRVRQVMSSV